jgi:hypothetical protein
MLDVMDAAADRLESVVGAGLTAMGVDATFHSGRLHALSVSPTVDLFPGAGRDAESRMFDDDHDGGGYLFTVRARLTANDYDANQRILYRMMDDTDTLCLAAALVGDNLDGHAASLDCIDPSGEVEFIDPGGTYYGFQFTLRVLPAFS